MRIRTRVIGSGTDNDPYVIPFPTYNLIDIDIPRMRAIIEIPDRAGPDDIDPPGTPLRPTLNGQPTVIGMRPQQRLAWLAKVRRMYARTHGDFDPDILT